MDLLVEDGRKAVLLALEHAGRTRQHRSFHTADLGHTSLSGQVALEDRQVPLAIERIVQRTDHVLTGRRFRRHIGQQLPEALSLHGAAVAMKQAGIQEQLHHLRDSTGPVQIHGHVATAGFEVADHRHPLTDHFEVIDAELHARGAGDGQKVQHRIGGSTHGHDHADGVFKCLPCQQIQRPDVGLHRVQQHLGGTGRTVRLLFILRRHGGAVGQAESHRLDGCAHRVGGEHAATAAGSGAGILLNRRELLLVDPAAGQLTHRFEGTDHRQIATPELSRLDRAGKALAVAGGFDGIGDHFPAHQGVLHAFGAHRDAVADGDGPEHLGHATGLSGRFLSTPRQIVQPDVAGSDCAVAVGDAEDRLAEILIPESDSPQHGAVGGALDSLGDGVGSKHGPEG